MRAVALIAILAILGLALYFWLAGNNAPDQSTLARMLGQQSECRSLVADMRRLGLLNSIVDDGPAAAFVYVNQLWENRTIESKLTDALILYCALMPTSGYYTVTVRNISGNNVFRIKNGHVVPWLN